MIAKLFSSQLRRNMLAGMVTNGLSAGVLLVGYPIYLHYLGYEKYGVWLVLATVLTFCQLGNLGIGPAVTKLVAEEYGRGNVKAIEEYVATAMTVLAVTGTIALLAVICLKAHIISAFGLTGENAQLALRLLPYVGALTVYLFLVLAMNATLSGLGRMDLANYSQLAGRVISVAVAAVLLWLGRGIESLLIANLLSTAVVHVTSLTYVRRQVSLRFRSLFTYKLERARTLLKYGGGVFGGSLVNMLLNPFNTLVLSRYAGVSAVPIYDLAFNGSMQIRAFLVASFGALTPEVSRVGAVMTPEAHQRIERVSRRAFQFLCVYALPVYLALGFLATPLLRLWLRDRFVVALPPVFRILLIGSFVSALSVPAYHVLIGLGRIRQILTGHIVQSGINVLLGMTCILVSARVSPAAIGSAAAIAMASAAVYLIYEERAAIRMVEPCAICERT